MTITRAQINKALRRDAAAKEVRASFDQMFGDTMMECSQCDNPFWFTRQDDQPAPDTCFLCMRAKEDG